MQNRLQGKKTSPQEKMGLRTNLQMKQKPVLKNQNLANVLTLKGSILKKNMVYKHKYHGNFQPRKFSNSFPANVEKGK